MGHFFSGNSRTDNAIPEADSSLEDLHKNAEDAFIDDDDEEPEIPPALPIIQPLSSREVSLESLDMILKVRYYVLSTYRLIFSVLKLM